MLRLLFPKSGSVSGDGVRIIRSSFCVSLVLFESLGSRISSDVIKAEDNSTKRALLASVFERAHSISSLKHTN